SPGDDIKLSFPAPENSRAIITLENSTAVLEEIRANTTRGNTVVTFRAKPEMAPGVYAYVTVIQPHAQTLNDMPMRLYGVLPVSIEDPQTHLEPVISMASEIRSQKSFDVKVSEANRKPMTYTLAVVDEGLLGITAFKTPDPWKYFYAREALGIQTWDLYDMVLGAFGGTLDRVLAVGGDEAVIDRSANKAQRFVPVVKFLGPFTLGPGKSRTHSITLPQYTGAVRTMVIAGNDRAFGAAEKSVIVKDPLMILVTAPRVISPGEKAALPVTLFIQKDGIRNIDVMVESDNLVSVAEKVKSIPVSGQGEKNLEFMLTSGEKTGISRIKVTASGGGGIAVYELALNIRSPNPPEIRSEMKLLGKGEKWESSFEPFGIEGSNSASLEISTLPSVNPEKNLDYLLNYPHGCTEQVVSSAFPQLWIINLAGKDAKELQSSEANIKEGISKVVSRQMAGGGIALWPGSLQPDNWVTSYAGHFMIEAGRNGYNIPSGFMKNWLSFQQKAAVEWRYDQKFRQTAYDQAYRLLTLALAGEPDRGAMNRLRESEGIPQVSKWLLSAAFAVSGRPEAAGDLLDMRNTQPDPEYADNYYGSDLRDKAIILYTLSILKNYEQALPVLKEICDEMNGENWYSTQSLAWGLFSYMKFLEMVPGGAESGAKVNIDFNGEGSAQEIEPKKVFTKALELKTGTNRLAVGNQSDKPVYVNLVRKGVPLSSEKSRANSGLSMTADYVSTDMKAVDPASLQQGEDFMMEVKVTNNGFMRVENIALTQMVPSGWEIRNTRMFEAGYEIKESSYDYRDFRDDRVNTYFSLNRGETRTFVLVLNAAYKGEFYQPSLWCEAMYTRNFYCSLPGRKVAVTGQKIE
ncbi:MAG: alpha-2-macroglobulin family protein, partial [Bacteroidales bacterium]